MNVKVVRIMQVRLKNTYCLLCILQFGSQGITSCIVYLYLTDLEASFSVFLFQERYFSSGLDLSNSLVKHQLIMSYALQCFPLCAFVVTTYL